MVEKIQCKFLGALLAVLLLLAPQGLKAQQKTITGTVTAADGSALTGASVVVKGTRNGTSTDGQGHYALTVSTGNILVFTYTGYLASEKTVGSGNVLNAVLAADNKALDEVVIVGYGTQKKSKITGSVAKLDSRVLQEGVRANPASALAGTIPGLRVQQSSGRPGAVPSITLRGGTNFDGSGSPLIVVDGFLRNSFSEINPADIESIEVLKDASATAIYGARASDGVILVTTRQGRAGRAEINISAKTGVNTLNNPYQFLNAHDYLYWSRMAIVNSGVYDASRLSQLTSAGPFGTGNRFVDGKGNILDGNVDPSAMWSTMILDDVNKVKLQQGWQTMTDPVNGKDVLIFNDFDYSRYALKKSVLTQDYNLNMTGGNDKGKYYAGLGYYNEAGMPINTYYKRLNFTFNGDYKLQPWLTSSSSFSYADAVWRDIPMVGEGSYFGRMLGAPPTLRGVNEKGDLLLGRDASDGNPAVNDSKFIRNNNTDKFNITQSFKVDFMRNLSLRVAGNFLYDEGFYESFNRDYLASPGNVNVTRSSSASFGRVLNQTYNAVLNYGTNIAQNHHIDLMAGTEYFDRYSQGMSASGQGAPTDDFRDLGLTLSDKDKRGIDSYHIRQRILSFFGRANYDYLEKYLLTVVMRTDGYSKLINHRYGTFPGVSAGWVISKEPFMDNLRNTVNFLKLKAGWGQNGNVSDGLISAYGLQGAYGTTKYNGSVGYLLTGLPFPDLLWERSTSVEAGLEANLFNRLDLSVEVYRRLTSNKISSFTLPASAGYSSLTTNNGSIQNTGVEASLNYRVYRQRDWDVNFYANMAYVANKIVKLPNNGLPNNRQGGVQIYDPASGKVIWAGGYQEGQDPSATFAYGAAGLYRTQADLDADARRRDMQGARVLLGPGLYSGLTTADKSKYFPIALGDVRWEDRDKNDTIDYRDRKYVGRLIPRWTGGFGLNAKWRGLYLGARFDYALGFVQYDGPRSWFLGNMQGTFNTTTDVFDTWTPQNVNAKYPTYYWADQLFKNNMRESTMFYKKGDYLALREIVLSYDLPARWVSKIKSKGVSFNVTGQNLTYFSASTLFSPEAGSQGVSGSAGYPLPRTVIFGVNIKY